MVFQGLHMLFAGNADREWKRGEKKLSEMVFIGKNLNQEWFQKQFEGCIAEGQSNSVKGHRFVE
ncbi:GTP-binding protein [Ectobacillus panaciterrae]|uniref:GTP-binding protein n=1 Tax=Ectobacillus panaciterrae TaxID=363872 RepID=UPI001FE0B155|nr:GTP-binding protein [Ectobacillus panaciterrae]